MIYEEFLQLIDQKFHSASYKAQLRYGQYVMNELYNAWPEKYAELTGSEYDCFYNNTIVIITLDKLKQDWKFFNTYKKLNNHKKR